MKSTKEGCPTLVYKKYTKKNGKVYGPYLYHNKRIGDKIVTFYHGKGEEVKSNKILAYILLAIIVLLLGFYFYSADFVLFSPIVEQKSLVVLGDQVPGTKAQGTITNALTKESQPDKVLFTLYPLNSNVPGAQKEKDFSQVAAFNLEGTQETQRETVNTVLNVYYKYVPVARSGKKCINDFECLAGESCVQGSCVYSQRNGTTNGTGGGSGSGGSGSGGTVGDINTAATPGGSGSGIVPPDYTGNKQPGGKQPPNQIDQETCSTCGESGDSSVNGLRQTTQNVGSSSLTVNAIFNEVPFRAFVSKSQPFRAPTREGYEIEVTSVVTESGKNLPTDSVHVSKEGSNYVFRTDYFEVREISGGNLFHIGISKTGLTVPEVDSRLNVQIFDSEENVLFDDNYYIKVVNRPIIVLNGELNAVPVTEQRISDRLMWKETFFADSSKHEFKISAPLKGVEFTSVEYYDSDGNLINLLDGATAFKEGLIRINEKESNSNSAKPDESANQENSAVVSEEPTSPENDSAAPPIVSAGNLDEQTNVSAGLITGDAIFVASEKQYYAEMLEGATYMAVYFTTEGISLRKSNEGSGKISIGFSGPEGMDLSRVPVYVSVGVRSSGRSVKLVDEKGFSLDFSIVDDKIEFLGDAGKTYTIIILIEKAEHLDANRAFISDIYDSVKALDGNWSETIKDGEFVRTVFEQKLDKTKDITIYPRVVSGTPGIEVYEANGVEEVARFDNLKSDEYNKVYLTKMNGSSDSFDLRVVNGSVELDYIVDPSQDKASYIDIFDCGSLTVSNKAYRLMADIYASGNPQDACLLINAQNMSLYGNGYSINFDALNGGVCSNPTYSCSGIAIVGGRNIVLNNIIASGWNDAGIAFTSSSARDVFIRNGNLSGNGNGIIYYGLGLMNNVTISNNIITSNLDKGILLSGFGNVVFNNSLSNNVNNGIFLVSSTNNTLAGNSLVNNSNGIYLDSASGNNVITNNTANNNSVSAGITIYSQNNTVLNNTLLSNWFGYVVGNSNNSVSGGLVGESLQSAVYVNGGTGNLLNGISITKVNPSGSYLDLQLASGVLMTNLIDMPHIGNYSFAGGNTLTVRNSQYGEIKFLQGVSGSGNNLTRDIQILNNSAIVRSDLNLGLNKPANVTLYGISDRGFSPILILRDGATCTDCYNFTALNAVNVIFNVTGWTNYSIGGGAGCLCGTLNAPNSVCTLTHNLQSNTTCFTIAADNVTIEGSGFSVTGNGSSSTRGVDSSSPRRGLVVNNLKIVNFSDGFYLINSNSIILTNVTSILNSRGLYAQSTTNLTVYNSAFNNNSNGIRTVLSTNNSFFGSTTNYNTNYGIYFELDSDGNKLVNNTANSNFRGFLTSSSYTIFVNNTANSNTQYGFYLLPNSNHNVLVNNTANSNSRGFFLDSNFNNTLNFNTANLDTEGIYLLSSSANYLNGNNMNSSRTGISYTSSSSGNYLSGGRIFNSSSNAISLDSLSSNNTFSAVYIEKTNSSRYDIILAAQNLNDTVLIDMLHIGNYSFAGGNTLTVRNSQYGEIKFLQGVSGNGNNLTKDIQILNNSAVVRSDLNSGLNKPANVTLYGIGDRGFSGIAILRDGSTCPTGVCYNFTSLTAQNVIFNVTGWTNYSIGGGTLGCGVISSPGVYALSVDLFSSATCFTISADNVTIDGRGLSINGTSSAGTYGILASNVKNLTVKNITIRGFWNGISLENVNNSLVFNSNMLNSSRQGINLTKSNFNSLFNNTFSSDFGGGVEFVGASYNNLSENKFFRLNNSEVIVPAGALSSDYNKITVNSFTAGGELIFGIGFLGSAKYNEISGNYFANLSASAVYFSSNDYYNTISNNIIENPVISVEGISISSSYNSLVNNTIRSNNAINWSYGIVLSKIDPGFENASHSLIANNTISNSSVGVEINSELTNISVAENYFRSVGTGINIISHPTKIFVLNNTIERARRGINLYSNVNDVLISGNIVKDFPGIGVVIGDPVNLCNGPAPNVNRATLLNNEIYNLSGNYSILDCSTSAENYLVYNNSVAEIRWTNQSFLHNLTLKGNLRHGASINVSDNFAYLNASAFSVGAINSSANITLYNLSGKHFMNPKIYKDDSLCVDCYNFTALNSSTVVFNVSSWSGYSIEEDSIPLSSCRVINVSGRYNINQNIMATGTCFNITADNVFIGQKPYYLVTGDGAAGGYGVVSVGTTGIYLSGMVLDNFSTGVYLEKNNNSNVAESYISNSADAGIALSGSSRISLSANEIRDSFAGIKILNSQKNELLGNKIINSRGDALVLEGGSVNNTISKENFVNTISSAYDLNIKSAGINETILKDNSNIGKYFINNSGLVFANSQFGEIRFLRFVNGTGNKLTDDIILRDNYAEVRSDFNRGLNVSANITFYNINERNFTNITVLRNGKVCGSCYNFTALNATNVTFNASSWTFYQIGTGSGVNLISPPNGILATDRMPTFVWKGTQDDGSWKYEFNFTSVHNSGTCVDQSFNLTVSQENYSFTSPLNCFSDNIFGGGDYYKWKVRGYNDTLSTLWSQEWIYNLTSLIDVRLSDPTINFGSINIFIGDNTTDNVPPPFVLENHGNIKVNITINATNLWQTYPNNASNIYYQFRADNYNITGGNNLSFVRSQSQIVFTPMPNASVPAKAVTSLNWTGANMCEIDILAAVPPTAEPVGNKSSALTFTASLGE